MKTSFTIDRIIQQYSPTGYKQWLGFMTPVLKQVAKTYADWRVGARRDESRNTDHRIVLTFDDSGTRPQVEELLRTLAELEVRAVFFVQTDWATAQPELIAEIKAAGHMVGDHTYSHPNLLKLSDDQIRDEIGRGITSRWLRPPQGRYNERIRRIASEKGSVIKYWSIDSDDWKGTSASEMTNKILRELHPGAVILFHIHGAHTVSALGPIVQGIRDRGFEVVGPGQPIWGEH